MSKNQDDRSSGVACTSRTDGQTNRQTRRQTDRQTDRQMKGHSESAYFAKLDLQTELFTLLIDCDKGQGHNQLVLMTQMKGGN